MKQEKCWNSSVLLLMFMNQKQKIHIFIKNIPDLFSKIKTRKQQVTSQGGDGNEEKNRLTHMLCHDTESLFCMQFQRNIQKEINKEDAGYGRCR